MIVAPNFSGRKPPRDGSATVFGLMFMHYRHHEADIRDTQAIEGIFARYGNDISLVIHTGATLPRLGGHRSFTDFTVNANGTSVLLEATRRPRS